MLELVKNKKVVEIDEEHINLLGETLSGKLAKAASKFIRISEENIRNFVSKKCKVLSENLAKNRGEKYEIESYYSTGLSRISWETRILYGGWFHGYYRRYELIWIETPFEEYDAIVPKFVAEKYQEVEKLNLFDSLVVCSLKFQEKVPDPILVGRFNKSKDRFFITQWDNDILLDDLL